MVVDKSSPEKDFSRVRDAARALSVATAVGWVALGGMRVAAGSTLHFRDYAIPAVCVLAAMTAWRKPGPGGALQLLLPAATSYLALRLESDACAASTMIPEDCSTTLFCYFCLPVGAFHLLSVPAGILFLTYWWLKRRHDDTDDGNDTLPGSERVERMTQRANPTPRVQRRDQ